MKTQITAVLAVLVMFSAYRLDAQQLPQFSMFQETAYILNPAMGGRNPWFDAKGINRSQWSGITDAPRTFAMSLDGPLKNPHIGLGGYLFTDNVGPTRRTGIQLSYAHHFNLNESTRLSFGLSMGAMQFAIDGSKIRLAEEGDPALLNQLQSHTVFDATFGVAVHGENWYAGVALPQLLQNQVRLYDSVLPDQNRLEDHYYFMAGYTYDITDDWAVEPALLVKVVQPVPVSWELQARAWYRKMVWAGISYRKSDAIIAMAGYQWNESLTIGYAYDVTTSNLRRHSSGSHEIILGFRFRQD